MYLQQREAFKKTINTPSQSLPIIRLQISLVRGNRQNSCRMTLTIVASELEEIAKSHAESDEFNLPAEGGGKN